MRESPFTKYHQSKVNAWPPRVLIDTSRCVICTGVHLNYFCTIKQVPYLLRE